MKTPAPTPPTLPPDLADEALVARTRRDNAVTMFLVLVLTPAVLALVPLAYMAALR